MMAPRLHAADAVYCRVDHPVDRRDGRNAVATAFRGMDLADLTKEDRLA